MIVVRHRRNTLAELAATPRTLGVEMDVRSRGSRLVVAHDPGADGVELDAWLDSYGHALLVANPKEEGLVAPILAACAARGLADVVLLGPDPGEALPWWSRGDGRVAVRVSEIHSPETALRLAGRTGARGFVWVDAYDAFPLDPHTAGRLHAAGLRMILCSPELYGRDPGSLRAYQRAAEACRVPWYAVCTAVPEAWG